MHELMSWPFGKISSAELMFWPAHIQKDPAARPATNREAFRDYLEGRCNSRGEYFGENGREPREDECPPL